MVFGSGTSSPAAAWVALEQTGHCVPSWAAVEVARDVGKFSRGELRGSYPEPGLGWQLRLRPSAHAVVPEFMRAAFVFLLRLCGQWQTLRRCPKCLRLSHADALSESRGDFHALRLETSLQRTLAQHHAVAGQQPCTWGVLIRTREVSLLWRQFPQPFRIDCKASVVKWLRTWVNDRPAHVAHFTAAVYIRLRAISSAQAACMDWRCPGCSRCRTVK